MSHFSIFEMKCAITNIRNDFTHPVINHEEWMSMTMVCFLLRELTTTNIPEMASLAQSTDSSESVPSMQEPESQDEGSL